MLINVLKLNETKILTKILYVILKIKSSAYDKINGYTKNTLHFLKKMYALMTFCIRLIYIL